ncbi:hypothetical protein BKA64DRAFT_648432 [Cadophora sp. MPI-SDFR-AT-0126]|nr:hypothetical protein BKA64DRAFT_648432 [Leotiomycetes sp. MPI-SDFR-AT-0126]
MALKPTYRSRIWMMITVVEALMMVAPPSLTLTTTLEVRRENERSATMADILTPSIEVDDGGGIPVEELAGLEAAQEVEDIDFLGGDDLEESATLEAEEEAMPTLPVGEFPDEVPDTLQAIRLSHIDRINSIRWTIGLSLSVSGVRLSTFHKNNTRVSSKSSNNFPLYYFTQHLLTLSFLSSMDLIPPFHVRLG